MIKFKILKEQWIKDSDLKKEYEALDPEFERAREFILRRIENGQT